jgi:hypothetical protein
MAEAVMDVVSTFVGAFADVSAKARRLDVQAFLNHGRSLQHVLNRVLTVAHDEVSSGLFSYIIVSDSGTVLYNIGPRRHRDFLNAHRVKFDDPPSCANDEDYDTL